MSATQAPVAVQAPAAHASGTTKTPATQAVGAVKAPATQAPAVVQSPAAPIPFRPEHPAGTAGAGSVFLVMTVLLAGAWAVLWYGNKRGWFARWLGGVATRSPESTVPSMSVRQALRLSPRTMLYKVEDAGREFLVVECVGGVHGTIVPVEQADGR